MMLPGLPPLTAEEHCFATTWDQPCPPTWRETKPTQWVLIDVEATQEQDGDHPEHFKTVRVHHWAARKDGQPLLPPDKEVQRLKADNAKLLQQITIGLACLEDAMNTRFKTLEQAADRAKRYYKELETTEAQLKLVRKAK